MTEDTIKNLIKLTRDVDDAGNLSDAGQVVAHIGTTKTFTVTVASKTSAHRYNGSGSGNGYVIDGVQAPYIELLPDVTYQFDQSDSSNSGHPLRFYLEADKTTQYSTGVTTNGTPGSSGAYTQIAVTDATPVVLYYQCSSHAFMGNAVSVENKYIINTFASNTYAASTFAGNTYAASTFTSNNSLNTRLGGFVANSFFQDQPSGLASPLQVDVYSSGSGNYTVPAGANFVAGFAIGAGGGGGGYHASYNNSGGGGGAGAAVFFSRSATAGASIAYSIGSGGIDGTESGSNSSAAGAGAAGGSTTFGNTVTAGGGNGGRGGRNNSNNSANGGSGGTGSGSAVAYSITGGSGESNPNVSTASAGGTQDTIFTPSAYTMYNQGNSTTIGNTSIPSSSISSLSGRGSGGNSNGHGGDGYLIVYAYG